MVVVSARLNISLGVRIAETVWRDRLWFSSEVKIAK